MKTRKSKNGKVLSISGMLLLIMLAISCSKDDDMSSPIEAKTQTFEVSGVNDCSTSSGSGSTLIMKIPYSAPSGTTIQKLRIKTTVSNGESDDEVNTSFTNNNDIITWGSCFRFGSQSWVEFEVKLEASDGTLSNASKVKINKPNGAN